MRGEYAGRLAPPAGEYGPLPGTVTSVPSYALATGVAGAAGAADVPASVSFDAVFITQRDTFTNALTIRSAGASYVANLISMTDSAGNALVAFGFNGNLNTAAGIKMNGSTITFAAFLAADDLRFLREGAKLLKLDDAAGGAADLHITGNLTVDGTVPSATPLAHGASLHTDRARTLFVPASVMTNDTGTVNTINAAPDKMTVITLADAATQGAYAMVQVPNDYVSGFTVRPVWAPAAGDAVAHTVRWDVTRSSMTAGTDITAAGTTTAWTGDSAARTINLVVLETGQAITPSAGNFVRLFIRRIGADAADTYVGNVNLIGLQLDYLSDE